MQQKEKGALPVKLHTPNTTRANVYPARFGSEDVASLAEEKSEISVSSSGSVNNLLEESDLE